MEQRHGWTQVKITGQVYFEVAHNAKMPFLVKVNGQTIQVLGTHFNVNAYDDEPSLRTTLLEGRVKVSKAGESTTLTPGEQSVIFPLGNKIIVEKANIEEVTAWKDGHFHFESDNIQAVMRQFARWYDVDVEYDGQIPVRAISGDIDRNSKASVALQILSLLKIHTKIEGRKIIITP
jgi:transmembrane sensor